jgi:hypothetical protein
MKCMMTLIAAAAVALTPTGALGAPGAPNGTATHWDHMNGPPLGSTGKPIVSCEDLGNQPGNSALAPGGGSPFSGENSTAGSHYAGTQDQNSRNFQSFSAYDVACEMNNSPHP